jgi:hypothetical protein
LVANRRFATLYGPDRSQEIALEAVALIFRADFRRRWRSWLVLVMLVSLVGGIVLAVTAAGRRTATAFPSFVTAYGYDALVYAVHPAPQLARLPEVASAVELLGPLSGQPTCTCAHLINAADFGVIVSKSPGTPAFGRLLSGYLPDPSAPDDVLASLSLEQDDGVQIGTVIHVPFDAPSQFMAAFNETPLTPKGPAVALRVVGIEVSETDFPGGQAPTYDLIGTQALARTVIPRTAFAVEYLVRLRSAADLPRFNADVNALSSDGVAGSSIEEAAATSVETAIHPQAVGW